MVDESDDNEWVAGDEQLDSGNNPVISGTYPSPGPIANFIVRAAAPVPNSEGKSGMRPRSNSIRSQSGDRKVYRKRVGIDHVTSSLKCSVHPMRQLEASSDGVGDGRGQRVLPLDIQLTAHCVGFDHPGVETELAIEASFDQGQDGREINWVPPEPSASPGQGLEWKIYVTTEGLKPSFKGFEWAISKSRVRDGGSNAVRRQLADSPTPGDTLTLHNGPRSGGSLAKEGTSSTGSSFLSRFSARTGSSVASRPAFTASLMREPLPGPSAFDMDDFPEDDESQAPDIEMDEESLSERQALLRRHSSGEASTSALSQPTSLFSQALTRNDTELEDSVGHPTSTGTSSLFGASVLTGFTNFADSPRRPRSTGVDEEVRLPSEPILLNVDLDALLSMQLQPGSRPSPGLAKFSFIIEGRVFVPVPEDVDMSQISVALPMWRFCKAKEHSCRVRLSFLDRETMGGEYTEAEYAIRRVEKEVQVASQLAEGASSEVVITVKPPKVTSTPHQTSTPVTSRAAAFRTPMKSLFPAEARMAILGAGPSRPSPADDLSMPSPFASRHYAEENNRPDYSILETGLFETPAALITRAEVNVLVSPPQSSWKGKSRDDSPPGIASPNPDRWRYTVHVQASWPFPPGSNNAAKFVEVGIRKPQGAVPKVTILSTDVGKRPALGQSYMLQDAHEALSDPKWLAWIKVQLPDGMSGTDGDLLFVYEVEVEPGTIQPVDLDLLLPAFAMSVSHVDVTLPDIKGM